MLGVLGWGWATAARLHTALYARGFLTRRRLERPVISVGALSVGGAGKTPTAALLAAMLADAGYRPAILSRGYRRRTNGPLLVSHGDGAGPLVGAREGGDEPCWLAGVLPDVVVAVAERRDEASRLVLAHDDVDVFLLDDGFQHHRVARDADLVMVDAAAPFWSDAPLPGGGLREAPAAVRRADALLVLGDADAAAVVGERYPPIPTFALHPQSPRAWPLGSAPPVATPRNGAEPAPGPTADLAGHPAFAFAGIARPQRFFGDLQRAGVALVGQRVFPDHHGYSEADLGEVVAEATALGATRLLTTEKDAVRLVGDVNELPTFVWGYRLAADAPDELLAWLEARAGLRRPTGQGLAGTPPGGVAGAARPRDAATEASS